ncbi:glycosyltransferase [Rhizobium sp. FY34]|uniref:glycosyltransferase n=1 Tax=Rhizobium sp. FY34 TaxID=2562309 RepID=UPI0010C06A40|nr:glycosyltransferase [Rhizobium sp. FY34]
MRVLHFFKTYYPDTFGGVERTIHAIAKGSIAHGIETDVLSLSSDPVANSQILDGHRAQKAKLDFEFASTGFSRDAFKAFSDLSRQADIVHYHFPWPFMDLVHLLKPPGKPTLVTYHSDIVKQKTLLRAYTPLMHRFLSSVDRVVATSDNYVKTSAVLQRYENKLDIIPIGLDEADYPRAPKALAEQWQSQFKRPFFLFVGVLRYYKGIQFLVEAAKGLAADIVILGEGPMEVQLKAQVSELGLQNIHFLGKRSDLDKAALLELCTALVFPSHLRSEAFGLSLVEAAMFGKPMISCEIGTGTSFVNRHGITGIVVPPGDAKALHQAMQALLTDSGRTHAYGHNARQHYTDKLRSSLMVERYNTLYRKLAASSR